MADTHTGDPVNSSISQAADTDWKNPPTLLKTEAIQRARKRGSERGRAREAVTVPERNPARANRESDLSGVNS
jgi:hypothetical protein